jgi:hypothetical protein
MAVKSRAAGDSRKRHMTWQEASDAAGGTCANLSRAQGEPLMSLDYLTESDIILSLQTNIDSTNYERTVTELAHR